MVLRSEVALLFIVAIASLSFQGQASASTQILRISRYAGFGAQNEGATETLFSGDEGGPLSGNQNISVKVGDASKCEKLLKKQQFPLQAMVKGGKLTPEQAEAYALLAKDLKKDAIHFFEVLKEVSRDGENLERLSISGRDFQAELHATLWSISGQNQSKLPWMLEPKRRELGDRLDRQKYRFIWELGRWSQDIPDFSVPAVSAALSTMVQEYIANLGTGNLDDAYVMIHSVTPVHTRYYDGTMGLKQYRLDGETDPGDCLYAVPIQVLLKMFPPSEHSERLGRIKRAFAGVDVSEQGLILIANWADRLLWEEFDFKSPNLGRSQHSVVFRDHSGLLFFKVKARIERLGIPDHLIDAVVKEATRGLKLHSAHWNKGEYPDLPQSIYTFGKLVGQNAIEISNLDSSMALAASGEEYLFQLLTHALVYNLVEVHSSREAVSAQSVAPWAQAMIRDGVHFAISTFDERIAMRLDRLNPETREKIGGEGNPGQVNQRDGISMMAGFLTSLGVELPDGFKQLHEASGGRPIYLRSFSAKQLFDLMSTQRPDLWVMATQSGALADETYYSQHALRAPVGF